jgi:quercetin dioxygenase-like cupin family protein
MSPTLSQSPATQRTFDPRDFVQYSDRKATVVEIAVTEHASLAVWGVRPGQEVPAHTHPDGQDTWIMLQGELSYYLGNGRRKTIRAGMVDIADRDQVHGAVNEGTEDAAFLSIYSAPKLGWVAATA